MGYDGSIIFDTHIDTDGFSSGTKKINDTFDDVSRGAEDAAESAGKLPDELDKAAKSTSRLGDIVKGGGVFKLIEKGVNLVVSSLDAAIDRYDTMNRFPMMLEQMGYGAEESSAAVEELSAGIKGLPTKLDSVVSTAQRLTVLTKNLDSSVDTTLALNNAFLASGASTDNASRGLEQYVQMLSKGTVDLESWRTLQETMGFALNKVAEAFGYAGESAQNDLYAALQSGEITFSQFNAMLIQLNGGVGGFAELAQTSSTGIKTAWTNLSTAVVRGTATIVGSIDSGLFKTRFQSIQNIIEETGEGIEDAMNLAAPAIELVAANSDKLAVSVGALTVAYGANKAVQAFTTAQKTATAAIVAADAAGMALTPTLDAKTLAEARAAAMTKLGNTATEEQIVAEMAANGVITAKTFALGGMTTDMGLATVATGLMTAATNAFSAAVKVALGPVGLVVLGLSALAAGAVAVYKAVTAESEAFEAQETAIDELAKAQESLADSEESSAKAVEENIKSIRSESDAAESLAGELDALRKTENKSASDKQRMTQLVDELNEKYADLCLTYDEENDLLSMNTEQLQEYIEAQQTLDEASALQQRYNELLEEESLIRQNKAELEQKQSELDTQLEQRLITQGEYNELLAQTSETLAAYAAQEQEYSDMRKGISEQLTALDTAAAQAVIDNAAAQQEAARAAAEAEEQELQRRKDALDSYTEAATNMFSRIETQSEVSVSEMIANLQHNQEAVAAWADNLVALGERGLDQGLLQELRDAGPESAATVAALVQASDEELQTLSETFRNGGEVAAEALRTELGLPEVTNAGSDMVDDVAAGVEANTSLTDATVSMIDNAAQAARAEVDAVGFPSIGQQAMNGIAAGVIAGTSGVVEAMRNSVRSAVSAARSEADIHSPSRLFRDAIGLNIMRGWALGVEDGEPLVISNVTDAMDALRREVAGGMNPSALIRTMRSGVLALQSSMAQRLSSSPGMMTGTSPLAAAAGVVNKIQNIYFEQPMQAPDEIARTLRIQDSYGLAGDR